jgi:glutathione synthase
MRVAFQMDHPSRLNAKTDTTFMLVEEAMARGHECYFYSPELMSWRHGELVAALRKLTFDSKADPAWTLGELEHESLHGFAMVWMRQDPPFDMRYITATHLLEQLQPDTKVFNDPAGVRNAPEKLSPLAFHRFMPPTLISLDAHEIQNFAREQGTIVAKPLYGFGGRSVFKLAANDPNIETLIEHWLERGHEPLMWQQFRPEVATSDKRILLIDGEVASVFQRRPADNSIRANMRVGGTPEKAELTAKEQEICAALKPMLKEQGLLLVGLDVIGSYLTEINVTSPTGLRAVQWLYGQNLAAKVWDAAEAA